MEYLTPTDRILVALDVPDRDQAMRLAETLAPHVGGFKVGLELFNACGPEILRTMSQEGLRVFYDAKFHDIPNTVAGAVGVAAQTGVWMINVHATGGSEMMSAAVEAAWSAAGGSPPLVVGVTVLTSIDNNVLREELRINIQPLEVVRHLAILAEESGLNGVVASPLEAAAIREVCGDGFLIVTPGVRPAWAGVDDQRRIATPAEAVANGADYLVIGRPILRAEDPAAAAQRVADELS